MSIPLFKHNEEAYAAALSMMDAAGKAAIVHPTGTGKSFIGFKLCEDHPESTVCWLSPSEYIFKTQVENLNAAGADMPQNIRFYTYAKLMNMREDELSAIQPRYIILDEFHRCGAAIWGQGVDRLLKLYPNVSLLGLSATAIRYLDNQRDMADELFDGNIASEMTLGEAIVRGILNPPKYVLSVFSYQKDLEKYQQRVHRAKNKAVRDEAEQYLEALRRALDKADGLDSIFAKHMENPYGKYIVFCANYEHLCDMVEKVPDWFSKVDAVPHVYSAYSDDPETSKAFSDFKEDNSDHLKLLFCIDMLNEGIHVEDISGVILLRPTVSPIIYKQQIGRALSASKKNNAIIFDIVLNIENLYSISAVEEEITEAVEYFRFNGESENIVNEKFTIIDEVRDCRRLFDALENALTASWDYMYLEAKQYFEENGNLLVPSKYITQSGYNLGAWLVAQRGIYNGTHIGTLTEEQIEKLNEIGMCWLVAHERLWEERYLEAKAQYEKKGNLLPPYENSKLKLWIYSQRRKFKDNTLPEEKVERLNAIGMVWEIDDAWEKMFQLASRYYEKYQNLDIPAKYKTEEGELLGQWYRRTVTEYRKGILAEERKRRLERIGFHVESVKVRTWMKYYAEAKKYAETHGNLNVHAEYVTDSGLKLGSWISGQRYNYRLGRLPKKRIELLDEIGMDWQRFDGKWNLGFKHLETYIETFGDAKVPIDYLSPDGFRLGAWVVAQRNKKTFGKLSEEKVQKLESVGIIWNIHDAEWENTFAALVKYQEQFGTLEVEKDYVTDEGINLRSWMANQRSKFRSGKLQKWKIEKLDAIDFEWTVLENGWETAFACAKTFYERNGNLIVPQSYRSDAGINLHAWIVSQRKSIKAGRLPESKIKRLYSIGFVLNPNDDAWETGFKYANVFFERNGHINMPDNYLTEDGFTLGEWLRTQRRLFKKGSIRSDRKERLDAFGMDWKKGRTPKAPH